MGRNAVEIPMTNDKVIVQITSWTRIAFVEKKKQKMWKQIY